MRHIRLRAAILLPTILALSRLAASDDVDWQRADRRGDRIPDFSCCGYRACEAAIPDAAARVVVAPTGGDDGPRIQAALDHVGSLEPDARGVRGAVLLLPGRYEVTGQLRIETSGIVLRGSGRGPSGTRLVATGRDRRTLIRVRGRALRPADTREAVPVVAPYVPVGARELSLESAAAFRVGDPVLVHRPSTAAWIEALGMDVFGCGWRPGTRDLRWDRTVVGVDGDTIRLDAPLTTSIDARFGGGTVRGYRWPGRIEHVGVENLRLVSETDPAAPTSEAHSWVAITAENALDAWIRQVDFVGFAGPRPTAPPHAVAPPRASRPLSVTGGWLTIDGKLAPGDGICIAHDSVNINTHQVILRHLRVRRGLPEGGQGSDNIGGNPEGQIIVDHCSTSWGMDENLSLYRCMRREGDRVVKHPTRNVTVQFCISSEALDAKNHAFGGTWGGEDSTFHHNLFACNTGRNPSIGMGGEFDYRNNVVFNWRHRTMDGGDETSMVNVIDNYYKAGPATNANMRSVIARIEERDMHSPGRRHEAGAWYRPSSKRPGKWYVAGNLFEGSPEVTRDNWRGMRGPERLARVNTPFEAWPVRQETAEQAYETVLAKAGATLPRRDPVDRRVVLTVRTGRVITPTGIVRSPEEVGGFPAYSYEEDEVPADTDRDGMPDDWERHHGLDPENAADARADPDRDGYTSLEEHLNGTDPRRFVDYRDLGNNVDGISG